MSDVKIEMKKGSELNSDEINTINKGCFREWGLQLSLDFNKKENWSEHLFFIVKSNQDNSILAFGEVQEVNNVMFMNSSYNILGVGGIISEIKGQGYGKILMTAIKQYILSTNKTAIGFCELKDFYKKCGFEIIDNGIKRFVSLSEKNVEDPEDHVLYINGEDNFIEHFKNNPTEIATFNGDHW